jgi:UDP-N-acetylmuramoyl-tripeptide--D-alanyl-D-alanine ligase
MIPVSLAWISDQIDGQLSDQVNGELRISGVSTDTRDIQKGDLFLALIGPTFDGNKFIQEAKEKGAIACITSSSVSSVLPSIQVADTRIALGQLGAAVKAQVAPKTIGITGSSGKTTVKEMVAAILSRRGKVLATKGNFNNDIGVPLTLLRLEEQHQYAVIEMGANKKGDIAYTASLVKPDVSTIVNAAPSHLEGFGNVLGVAQAKSEIFKHLPEDGLAVVNGDSQFTDYWLGKLKYNNVQTFSCESEADFRAQDITLDLDGRGQFQMFTPIGTVSITLSIPGKHNVSNALVAAALAIRVGASLEDVRDGLRTMNNVAGRLQVKQLTNQVKILDDTYNANVASVRAAIDLLSSFAGRKLLVLGDMGELGEKASYYHQQVGEYAQEKGISQLYSLGVLSQYASQVFAGQGQHFTDLRALTQAINADLADEQCDINILVKGSRSAKMELVVQALEDSPLGKFERRRERIAC